MAGRVRRVSRWFQELTTPLHQFYDWGFRAKCWCASPGGFRKSGEDNRTRELQPRENRPFRWRRLFPWSWEARSRFVITIFRTGGHSLTANEKPHDVQNTCQFKLDSNTNAPWPV